MSSFVRTTGASIMAAEARLVDIQVAVAGEREGGRPRSREDWTIPDAWGVGSR